MQKTAQVIEIEPVGEILIKYPITDVAIETLGKKFASLVITDSKTYKSVTSAIGEVRGYRISVENKRKILKKDALEYGRKVDGEAKRITKLLEPIENDLKEKKQAVDDKKAKLAEEKARIENDRVSNIRDRISGIQRITIGLNDLDVKSLENLLMQIEDEELLIDEYAEFKDEVQQAILNTGAIIDQAIIARKKLDDEDAAQKIEADRLEKIRLDQEAEANRLAEEAAKLEAVRKAEEVRLAEAQKKIDAENRKIEKAKADLESEKQAEINRKEREVLEKRLAAEAKVKAENDAKEKIERDEVERAAKEALDASEKVRLKALAPDKEKLTDFADWLLSASPVKVKSKNAKALADKAQGQVLTIAQNLISEIRKL